MYEYRAEVIRVVDGDTLHVEIDLGCDIHVRQTLRLAGINAPEMSTPEGLAAKDWLSAMLAPYPTLTIRTIKDRKERYGRYLAILVLPDGTDINQRMVDEGQAVLMGPYQP